MLKIILGVENVDKYIKNKRKFINFPNEYFNQYKEPEWFRDEFSKRLIKEIDKATIIADFAVQSDINGTGFSVNDLAGGTKTLMLMYNCPNNIVLAKMGDNCTKFVEWIASEFEKQGRDLIIVSNIIHQYDFKYIDKIHFINYNITCTSWQDVMDNVYMRWYNDREE